MILIFYIFVAINEFFVNQWFLYQALKIGLIYSLIQEKYPYPQISNLKSQLDKLKVTILTDMIDLHHFIS